MRLDFAVLADAVTVRDNLISVLGGGITHIGAFPAPPGTVTDFGPAIATGAKFVIGARFFLARGELGRMHKIESKITMPDGGDLSRAELQVLAPVQPVAEGDEASFCVGINVVLNAIPRLGPYSVDLFADGVHVKALPFKIFMAPGIPPGAPSPTPEV